MSYTTLTELEIKDLINRYDSELNKLQFQIERLGAIRDELHQQLSGPQPSTANARHNGKDDGFSAPAKKRGRKRKTVNVLNETTSASTETKVKAEKPKKAAVTKSTGKRGRKKSKTEKPTKGYRLSEFDQFVMNTLEDSGHILINSDFLDKAENENLGKKFGLNDKKLKAKLNQSLFKLSNKKDELAKVEYPGKGFAYSLPKWLDEYGNLKLRYQRNFETA